MSVQEELRLKELFDTYYSRLCDFAYYFVSDESEAENIVQQLFVDLWENRTRIFEERSLKQYLYTAVRNRCLNHLKRNKSTDFEDEPMADSDPSMRIQLAELNNYIAQLVDELPPKCRYIFLRSRRDGLTHKQIAEELDISTKTVENQVAKALKYLRAKIY